MSHLHFATVGHIFEVIPGAKIMHTISRFESWEVRSPALQTVHDLELKWRSYGCLKMVAQTMSGNVAAAPLLDTFWSTSWISNYVYYISFWILGSQGSSASNGTRFGGEMKKLWPFEDERAKLSGNFATETPFGRVFCSFETTIWHTSATSQHQYPHFAAVKWAAKIPLLCEIPILLRNDLQASKWLRNHLQASKWPSNCKIDLRNGGRFAKTPCKAKGSC